MKRTPIRRESEKRAGERREREQVAARARARDRGCVVERMVPDGLPGPWDEPCGGPLDAHEVIPRSAWPGGHLVLDNVRTVCRQHHRWVDNYPDDAERVGLHGRSWQR